MHVLGGRRRPWPGPWARDLADRRCEQSPGYLEGGYYPAGLRERAGGVASFFADPRLRADPDRVLGGHLTPARAEDALTDFDDLTFERWPSSDRQRRRAFQLRHNVFAYDAAYIALAEALDCPMLTRDDRLRKSAGHHVRIEVL